VGLIGTLRCNRHSRKKFIKYWHEDMLRYEKVPIIQPGKVKHSHYRPGQALRVPEG
jgi:hypothetical protein